MKNKVAKILFIIYFLALVYVLFFCNQRFNSFDIRFFSKENIQFCNFVPFRTITDYIERLQNGSINSNIPILNLGVNLILFMPMAVFVKVLMNNKIDKFWKFLLFILLVTIAVEILQFITYRGSLDIDDVILNTFGACIIYKFLEIKIIDNIINSIR